MIDKQNAKIDLGKTIIAIRSQFEAANSMDEINKTRDKCKVLCRSYGLKWWMVLCVDFENIRYAVQNNDIDNFLIN